MTQSKWEINFYLSSIVGLSTKWRALSVSFQIPGDSIHETSRIKVGEDHSTGPDKKDYNVFRNWHDWSAEIYELSASAYVRFTCYEFSFE